MVNDISLDMYAGSLVWWNASLSNKAALQDIARDLGIRVTFREVKPEFALVQAVTSVFYSHPSHHRGQLIRKAHASDGHVAVVVVREEVAENGNRYEATTRFEMSEDDWLVFSDTASASQVASVQAAAKALRGMVLGREVGTGIAAMLADMGAVQIRDGAKIFFVANAMMDRFREITNAFAAYSMPVKFLKTNCPVDADTAAGIADNATDVLRKQYEEIIADLNQVDVVGAVADNREKLIERRNHLINKLNKVKDQAEKIDAGFKGLLNIAEDIGREIDSAIAIAILTTSL